MVKNLIVRKKIMKRILMSLLFVLLMSLSISNGFAVVELDGDANGAVDIDKGGTNEDTIAKVKSSFEIEAPNKSFIINGAITDDDFLIWLTPVAITITDIKGVLQTGTNVVGGLDEVDSDGSSNLVAVDSDITFDGGLDEDDGTLTNGEIAANHWIKWHTTSVDNTIPVEFLTITIYYTID